MAARQPVFNQTALYDTTPLPDNIPKVKEVGATSAPLLSAAFFIGARCQPYNDDFMQCKNENPGRGELECLKEGRRVTRCASSVIGDINTHCLEEFRKHWQCLDDNNHQLWQCRKQEWKLNSCVYTNLKLEKTIPGAPKNEIPVHLRTTQIYAHYPILRDRGQKPFGKAIESPSAQAAQADAPAA
ncbi:NADH dehydrogenase, alpha subcomplex, subunit 8 [Annulohypoxylon maeteangense]|uniref:NADH dehydrogenase, alpha subcomplex, subunit 8 n=1 Tax=Annulohypoxylon maeteangense TaxID=1927788 RepID=UPI002007B38E|nr:NADH dehydrogenase, alpha subcomplex, subunit 8 [Annulohypoxylon maeteangense]KAI0885994.1 NADH dehydrogenase, alpha subcomplex, subunit 8 [Annulohypoxylon maeteangense]